MRLIGHVTGETGARMFSDYLSSLEIKSSIEPDSEGKWAVWIYSEDQVEVGKKHLADYLAHPSDPKYAQGARRGEQLQDREREAESKASQRVYTRDNIFRNASFGPVTLALILICVGLSLYTGFSYHPVQLHALYMSEQPFKMLPEVQHGELWRLITPIFIHMGPIHLLFNMLWMKTLGSTIELREGSWRFLLLVLVLGLASNFAEFYWTGPRFGGMSGVVYGLFGYVWMRGKFDPASGYFVPQQTVYMMIAWFFMCVFQIIPGVANAAHAGGLVAGMAVGALPSLFRR